jgi:hypothetical protein
MGSQLHLVLTVEEDCLHPGTDIYGRHASCVGIDVEASKHPGGDELELHAWQNVLPDPRQQQRPSVTPLRLSAFSPFIFTQGKTMVYRCTLGARRMLWMSTFPCPYLGSNG